MNTLRKHAKSLARSGLVLVLIMILGLSLLPGSDLPTVNANDKLNHFLAYSVLAALAGLARLPVSLVALASLLVIYGVSLEVAQGLMPYGRSASWLDALANTAGVLTGIAVSYCLNHFLKEPQ